MSDASDIPGLSDDRRDDVRDRPLGETLLPQWLSREVVTCEQASLAKGVPLRNELKTLVLRTSDGHRAVHIRGDHRLSLRAVKRFLALREAHLLSAVELSNIGLAPGIVCPFLPPVWYMHQLVAASVLDLEFATTNNGTITGYFVFDPQLLLDVPHVDVGEFEVATMGPGGLTHEG